MRESGGVEAILIVQELQKKTVVRGGNMYFRVLAYKILTLSCDSVCMICSNKFQVTPQYSPSAVP